ncbi:MAG: phospho-N-acetylmuramoyl-pentapeptide-transferase, partial [Chloroflexi bacterium CFX6]|nr:phospho-N-acetylmuramoyl-pentapeptide-transferase [Chloroflexi bacterium CFX6]
MNPFAPGAATATLALLFAAVAFAATATVTGPLTGWLRRRQLGKAIRVDGPDHAAKAGTPTMGGLGL